MTLTEDNRFLCVCARYYVSNFCRFANGGAKISMKSYFIEILFFSVHSAAVFLLPFVVNCLLQPAGLGEKRRCEVYLLYVKSDFGITDKSFPVFFAR